MLDNAAKQNSSETYKWILDLDSSMSNFHDSVDVLDISIPL